MLDELEKMLKTCAPQDTTPRSKLESPGVSVFADGTYSTATASTGGLPISALTKEMLDDVIAMINKPVSLGVSSRGYFPEVGRRFDADRIPLPFEVDGYVSRSLEEAAEAEASISLSKLSYNPSDYRNYVKYTNDDLFTDSPAIGDAFTIAVSSPLPPDTISISNDKGSIVVHLNGDIVTTGDITIKEASKSFWDSISYYAPSNQDTIEKLEREIADLKIRLQSYEDDKKFPEPSPVDSIGIRLLTEDIKKSVAAVLKAYQYEPNNYITRKYIKADVDNLLEEYFNNGKISDFATVCDSNNNNGNIGKGEKHIDISIKPCTSDNFIYLPMISKPKPPKDEPVCENQLFSDLAAIPNKPDSGYFYAPYIPVTKTDNFNPYSYDPYSIQEDFIFPHPARARGSKVETLPYGQSLGALDDLEYFRRKVTDAMAIPSDLLQATRQLDMLKASLATTPPSIVVDKDSDIGKHFVNQLRANKFDDAMELVK